MADPQTENGYLKIAMEIVEALARHRIPGQEMQLIWVLLRKTWGWNKKADNIPLSQWARLTGIKRTKCCDLLNSLIAKNIIKKDSPQKGTGRASKYRLNKNYEEWSASPQKGTPVPKKGLDPVPIRGTKPVPKRGLSIDKKDIYIDRAKKIIDYLNNIGQSKYTYIQGNLKHITARLKEGHTEHECKEVIDKKWNDVMFDKKYFRPKTLFNSENFEGYLNEKPPKRYT